MSENPEYTRVIRIRTPEELSTRRYRTLLAHLSRGFMGCDKCHTRLNPDDVRYYPHEDGIHVPGCGDAKQWVYVTCVKCGYEWSSTKLDKGFWTHL